MRKAGDPAMSQGISEGIWAAECRRLEAENAELRRRLAEAEARVGLFCWGLENERERRIEAQCKLNKRKASVWHKLGLVLGCVRA